MQAATQSLCAAWYDDVLIKDETVFQTGDLRSRACFKLLSLVVLCL
jgi:hypothetical protein